MLACGVREVACRPASRLPLYRGTGSSRLRWRPHRFATCAALLAALSTAGCAYQLDAGFTKPDADAYTFYLVPMRAGPLTLPGLDIAMADGSSLHMNPIKLVVYSK